MDIGPKYSQTSDSDSNTVYYDALEQLTGDNHPETTGTGTTMHSRKTSAPLTTTPVKPVIGDQAVANEIQEKRKGSKGINDDRRGHHTLKRYELVDEGPVGDRRRYREDSDEEYEGGGKDYEEEQDPNLNESPESEGWLPAVDEALPRQVSGKRSKSVGQTRTVSRRDEVRRRRSANLGETRRGSLYDHGDYDRQRNWGEPSASAKRSGSMRSAGTTGTTPTTDDGRVVRASAFLPNGAGTVGPGSRVRVEEGQQKNKGKNKSGFGWGLGIGKKDKIERELEKVVRAEGKTEKRALKDAIKELDGLTKVQKDAVKVSFFKKKFFRLLILLTIYSE